MPEDTCNDELDWGVISFFCELPPNHEEELHKVESLDILNRRPFTITWK